MRLLLGGAVLAVALGEGADARPAAIAFVAVALLVGFALLSDRRSLLLRTSTEPEPLPAEAVCVSPWRGALDAAFPSTAGLVVLSAVALGLGRGLLAAALGGALAGLGLGSSLGLLQLVLGERTGGERLFVELGPGARRFVAVADRDAS